MKKAFVFPGQGSQKIGMGKILYDNFLSAKDVFEEVNDSLSNNLSKIIFDGPQEELTLTKNAQPAIMAVSFAVIRVLENDFKINIKNHIDYFAGHSLGEYTALAASKATSLADTAKILYFRGKSMQESANNSKTSMAALMGGNIEKIREILNKTVIKDKVCDIANHNTDTQIVISGDTDIIEKAITKANEDNIKSIKLEVSAPFHSRYMVNTGEALESELKKYLFKLPEVKIVSNLNAMPFTNTDDIIDGLVKQTYSTVRWYESISYMQKMDVNKFYEIGFGSTLSGIIKRINRKNEVKNIYVANEMESLAMEML